MRFQVAIGGIDLLFKNRLKAHVDREADIFPVLCLLLLASIENDLAASAVALGVTKSVLAGEVFFHGALDSLHALALVVEISEHMTQHGVIRIGTNGINLVVNSAQVALAHFRLHLQNGFVRNLALQDEVFSSGSYFLRNLGLFETKITRDEFGYGLGVFDVGCVGENGVNR